MKFHQLNITLKLLPDLLSFVLSFRDILIEHGKIALAKTDGVQIFESLPLLLPQLLQGRPLVSAFDVPIFLLAQRFAVIFDLVRPGWLEVDRVGNSYVLVS